MSDVIEVTQKSAPVSNSTQIGVQYVGMTPEQAVKQTLDLFMENFPKLQALARETAEQRATEICNNILSKLADKQVKNLTPFTEPDVQFILYEAQKNYARFGDREIKNILAELIANRIQNDDKNHFKRIADNSIIIAGELSPEQLDCLSALFMLTRVKIPNIKTIDDVDKYLKNISSIFCLDNINYRLEISYLNFKGCLELTLPDIPKILSQVYSLLEEEIKNIMPKSIQQFSSDYGISEIGILLAIANAEQKSQYKFDPHTWVRD